MKSTVNEVWESFSNYAVELAEETGKAVVAVDAGHRVAASGVHWKQGIIVTASHLVRRAVEVAVILPDGSSVKGSVAGRDGSTDLAVIRIEGAGGLETLPHAAGAKVGELTLAVARSGRGELSASSGIVARVGGPWRSWRGGRIDSLLRPDVRLYPGQSGSALVNRRGELLGVNSAVLARESVITLPTITVDRVVEELLKTGHIAQPYLGIMMQEVPLPQEWRPAAGSEQEHGLLVMHVAPEGPAKRAGISLGDVIIAVNGQPVLGLRQLHHILGLARTGDKVKLKVLRGGSVTEADVELGDRPRR